MVFSCSVFSSFLLFVSLPYPLFPLFRKRSGFHLIITVGLSPSFFFPLSSLRRHGGKRKKLRERRRRKQSRAREGKNLSQSFGAKRRHPDSRKCSIISRSFGTGMSKCAERQERQKNSVAPRWTILRVNAISSCESGARQRAQKFMRASPESPGRSCRRTAPGFRCAVPCKRRNLL